MLERIKVSVFFLLLFFLLFPRIQAMIVVGRLSVAYPIELRILVDDELCSGTLEKAYCFGETLRISNELENVGNSEVSGNLSTRILNPSDQTINESIWLDVRILPGETLYKNTSYSIRQEDEIGIYTIRSNFSYVNSALATCNFWVYKGIGYLTTPSKVVLSIPPGGSENYTLDMWLRYACEDAIVRMNSSSGMPGNWTSFDPEEILLSSGGEVNSTVLTVTVPNGTELGTYYGWIYARADNQTRNINLTVVVSADFFLRVRIPADKKEVCRGSDVYAEVNVTKVSPPGEVRVNMTYRILHDGNGIAERREDLTLNDTLNSLIRVPVLRIPSDAPLGDYTFSALLEHNETQFESSDTFSVKDCVVVSPPSRPVAPPPPPPKRGLFLNLSTYLLSAMAGEEVSFVATVKNVGTQTEGSIKLSLEGIPRAWFDVVPPSADLPPSGVQDFLVFIRVPPDAKAGVYELRVKASDGVESNVETLILVVGKSMKEVADLLLEECERAIREAERSLVVEECVEVSSMKVLHEDSKESFEKGLEEYKLKNYRRAVDWFEYVIQTERRVIHRVDITLQMEVWALEESRIVIPPFFDPESYYSQAKSFLDEKAYEEVCDPIERIRKLVLTGLIFWPFLVVVMLILLLLSVLFLKGRRRYEKVKALELVRRRLGFPEA